MIEIINCVCYLHCTPTKNEDVEMGLQPQRPEPRFRPKPFVRLGSRRQQQPAVEVCHRFHTLIVSSSSPSPQRGIDFLITRESKLDGTTAESHKGSSRVAGHPFIHLPPLPPAVLHPPNLTARPPSYLPLPLARTTSAS